MTLQVAVRLAGGAAAAQLLPSVLTVPELHRRLLPRLSGRSALPHVALTFDDGPDAESTPVILDALERLEVRATFFVLGSQVVRYPHLARRLVDQGQEIAVHGWRHVPHLLRAPWAVHADLARTVTAIRTVAGAEPRFWRPPNGVLTGAGLLAARREGLRPVLWTTDGHDWRADATAQTIVERLNRQLRPGATVLLHDCDITSAPGCWRAALAALPDLVARCRHYGWSVGPLRDHWTGAGPARLRGRDQAPPGATAGSGIVGSGV